MNIVVIIVINYDCLTTKFSCLNYDSSRSRINVQSSTLRKKKNLILQYHIALEFSSKWLKILMISLYCACHKIQERIMSLQTLGNEGNLSFVGSIVYRTGNVIMSTL